MLFTGRRPAGLRGRRHLGPAVPAAAGGRPYPHPTGDPAGAEDQGGGGEAAARRDQPQERVGGGGPAEGVQSQAGAAALGFAGAPLQGHGHGEGPRHR